MFSDAKELIKLSLPLPVIVYFKYTAKYRSSLYPASLLIYGLSTSDALSTYGGVLTGMALPCILFPSALTNLLPQCSLPAITEAQTQKRTTYKENDSSSLCGCIFLGTGCLAGFFLLGPVLGRLLFHSSLCRRVHTHPFLDVSILYANSALISIIHGLGKTGISLLAKYAKSFHLESLVCLIFYSILGNPGYLHLPPWQARYSFS